MPIHSSIPIYMFTNNTLFHSILLCVLYQVYTVCTLYTIHYTHEYKGRGTTLTTVVYIFL